jgi:lysozyme family protein
MSAFEKILAFTLLPSIEGGYVNDPDDPGLRTDGGITERFHPGAWADGKVTYEEKRAIYKKNYWDTAGCERFKDSIAMVLFECAVNPGVSRAWRFLQAALEIECDGRVGVITLTRAMSADPMVVALRMIDIRKGYWLARAVAGEDPMIKYLNGWMNRSNLLRDFILKG